MLAFYMAVTGPPILALQERQIKRLHIFVKMCGILICALGILLVLSWHFHWTHILQFQPDTSPVQFNTALCFVMAGAGLFALTIKRAGITRWLGVSVALMGWLTLAEYLTGVDLGIDQLFFKPYLNIATNAPGRISTLSSTCLIFIGAALALTGLRKITHASLLATGLFACIVAMVAGMALFGYLAGIEVSYGWASYARMAPTTAVSFIILSLGLLTWTWLTSQQIHFNFLRWLPVTGSATLMAAIIFLSVVSLAELKQSTDHREHSHVVLLKTENLLDAIFGTQRGMRGYILSGLPGPLETYQTSVANIPGHLNDLRSLTHDNQVQQKNLEAVSKDIDTALTYSRKLLDIRKTQGLQAAMQLESTGEGFEAINRTMNDLRVFTDEERRLLHEQSTASDEDFRSTTRLLILGSALAALLLVLANAMANREVRLRGQAEEKLKGYAERFKLAVGAAQMGVWDWDVQTNHIIWDEKMYDLYGIPPGKPIDYQVWAKAVVPQDLAAAENVLQRVLTNKCEGTAEFRIVGQDGVPRHIYAAEGPMLDASGEVTRVIGVNIDITERKKIEDTLRISEERFRLIVDGVKDYALFMLNPKGRVVSWNTGAERINGYKSEEIIGQHFSRFYPPEISTSGHPEDELRIAEKEGRYEEEGWRVRKDGSRFMANVVITSLRDESGQLRGFAKITRDITERKRMEMALHDKNIELQNAAEAKNRFLANMSHELRTPLNGIIGFSELLVDGLPGAINADQKEYLEDILNSGQHLLQLINDVLDLAKVEAGKMELHPDKFSLGQAIKQVCSVAYPIVQKKKIQLTTTLAPEVDLVMLDQQKFKQVLYNLLSNAVKFTDERGQVDITVSALGTDRFALAVRDTGIGIKPENMKRLFKEFEQLDEGTTRQYQGTGLGLALTRRILEMQGGSIDVTSEFGKGSTFTITLPLTLEEVVL